MLWLVGVYVVCVCVCCICRCVLYVACSRAYFGFW
jgi:hypothetical protein